MRCILQQNSNHVRFTMPQRRRATRRTSRST
jgi:hypothetical protein